MAKRIEAVGVSAYYGAFKAIEGINLVMEPKSVTALIGPSGCGKSTFLRSVNRMHEVLPGARVEGRLTIDSQDIYGRDVDVTAVRRLIGMVFQRPNPFPTMSIYDNVAAGLRLNGTKKRSELDDAVDDQEAEPVRPPSGQCPTTTVPRPTTTAHSTSPTKPPPRTPSGSSPPAAARCRRSCQRHRRRRPH